MSATEQNADPIRAKVDDIVSTYMRQEYNRALCVGMLDGGQERIFGYGKLSLEKPTPPDGDTLFEIGSITKVFTATLLADMAERGEARLEDLAQKHLPADVRMPKRRGQEITLYHLATHTSSLPRLPSNLKWTIKDPENPYANYTEADLHKFLSSCRLWRNIGSRAVYSNLGVGLLGQLLARILGGSYEDAVRDRVCGPLQLTDTAVALSPEQQGRLAPGHSAHGDLVSNWDFPALAGAGALRSTVRDQLRFLRANLHPDATPLANALKRCHVVYSTTGSPHAPWERYLAAVILAGLGLLLQWGWPVPPGSWKYLVAFSWPIVGASLFGGRLPGALAALLTIGSSYGLWQPHFGTIPATIWAALLVAGFGRNQDPEHVLLGWQEGRLVDGSQVLWHNGGTGGYASFEGFLPGRDKAVVLLSNSENSVDHLGFELLEWLNAQKSDPPGQGREVPT